MNMMEIKPGDFICWEGYEKVRVMAVAENYAMLRRPGCVPFVLALKYLKEVAARKWEQAATDEGV